MKKCAQEPTMDTTIAILINSKYRLQNSFVPLAYSIFLCTHSCTVHTHPLHTPMHTAHSSSAHTHAQCTLILCTHSIMHSAHSSLAPTHAQCILILCRHAGTTIKIICADAWTGRTVEFTTITEQKINISMYQLNV